jgi:hypothetical protein
MTGTGAKLPPAGTGRNLSGHYGAINAGQQIFSTVKLSASNPFARYHDGSAPHTSLTKRVKEACYPRYLVDEVRSDEELMEAPVWSFDRDRAEYQVDGYAE